GTGDPRTLGEYRLLGRLGTGGMGQVFLGRTPEGRTVAIKLIHPHLAHEPEFRRRFRQEVAAARRVSGEWTMPVLDSDTEGELPWLATGFVPGPALTRVVEELHGALPEFSVWRLAEGLASALDAIHGVGVLHRDLKPSNVLLTLEGPRVIDFGIARAADASVATRTGIAVGSPGYMAPEQVRGERLTEASDVFGLGAVLAYAATGTGPFGDRDSAAHTLMHRVIAERPDLRGLAGPLRELVERCLDKEPTRRPTPREVAEEAARHVDPDAEEGVWLPAALTAWLGKEAAGLLALGGPEVVDPTAGPPEPSGTPYNMPTMTASSGPPPPPRQPTPPPAPAPALPVSYPQPQPQPLPAPYAYGTPVPAGSTVPMPQQGMGYPMVTGGYFAYAPFGVDAYGRPLSNKSRIAAGLLQIFLGSLGVGRFYLGHIGIGLAQLFTCGGFGIWALIDGIVLLVSRNATDGQGRILRG
ncbi:NINE protein, partial [Streptomyces sp. 8K308]|uniref:protein kinase domain-containing protein n=1 Tax=Streptomyces sp. 8K308 TaxID=2530388 RepID=UPI001052C973